MFFDRTGGSDNGDVCTGGADGVLDRAWDRGRAMNVRARNGGERQKEWGMARARACVSKWWQQ